MTEGFFRFGPVQKMVVALNVAAASSYALYCQIPTRRTFLPAGDSSVPVPSSWDVPTREECLSRLKHGSNLATPLDVLIIGGGATGSGIALDLASRGGSLMVGLVEAGDFASETSSRSSKLIHGGVRYLEKAIFGLDVQQLKLVFEALKERSVMLHQAPFLCQPLATVIPAYSPFDILFYWAGMKVYDLVAIAGRGVIGDVSYWQNPIRTLDRHPFLKHRSPTGQTLTGSIVYSDGVHDDARMCLLATLTAACFGAATVNHCRAMGIKPIYLGANAAASSDDAVEKKIPCDMLEVTLRDELSGAEFKVNAKTVINAAGPFSDQVRKLIRGKDHKATLAPSAGTHIALPAKYAPKNGAMLVPTSDGRVLFVIGWKNHCIAGTTDKPTEVSANPQGTESEVSFILESMKPFLGEIPRNEVTSVWSGIRPLAAPTSSSKGGTQNIIREHSVQVDPIRRMVSITGGKWTTYRKIAEDAVNALFDGQLLDRSMLKIQRRDSPTDEVQLLGAVGYEASRVSLSIENSTPKDVLAHWRSSYGERYSKVFEIAQSVPRFASATAYAPVTEASAPSNSSHTKGLPPTIAAANSEKLLQGNASSPLALQLIHPDFPITTADVVYSARYEHCMTVEDFVARRSRLAFINVAAAREASKVVADVLAREFKWSDKEKANQLRNVDGFLKRFEAKPDA